MYQVVSCRFCGVLALTRDAQAGVECDGCGAVLDAASARTLWIGERRVEAERVLRVKALRGE